MALYVVPFLSKDWTIFTHALSEYRIATVGEWSRASWPEGDGSHIYNGLGMASWFHAYAPGDMSHKIAWLQRVHLLLSGAVVLGFGGLYWRLRRRIDYRVLALVALNSYLVVFYLFIQIPYAYLASLTLFVAAFLVLIVGAATYSGARRPFPDPMTLLQGCLLVGCGLLALGSGVAWYRGRTATLALPLLMGAAFLLRLLMNSLDPFLHDWDERFHALVAKNMISHPLTPMLRAEPLFPYDFTSWCCNHIWLHKQPLFLWQMALSMKVFGVSDMAMRLPSALLGSLVLYPVYRLGCLLFDEDTGYLGALLAAFAFYQLEQTCGMIGMDHNDVAFAAYVTASIWAYYEYCGGESPGSGWCWWACSPGLPCWCKWLTGLVVYAGWGVAILLYSPRRVAEYGRLAASVAVAVAVFLPWQLYTAWRFPTESAYERTYNTRHFTEVLEGPGYAWHYHLAHARAFRPYPGPGHYWHRGHARPAFPAAHRAGVCHCADNLCFLHGSGHQDVLLHLHGAPTAAAAGGCAHGPGTTLAAGPHRPRRAGRAGRSVLALVLATPAPRA